MCCRSGDLAFLLSRKVGSHGKLLVAASRQQSKSLLYPRSKNCQTLTRELTGVRAYSRRHLIGQKPQAWRLKHRLGSRCKDTEIWAHEGRQTKKRGKDEIDAEKGELVFKEDGQEYADQVLRMLENSRCEAMSIDKIKLLCHIHGKMHWKV